MSITAIALFALIPAALTGPAAQTEKTAPPQNVELRILSFNIRYGTASGPFDLWGDRRDLVSAVLKHHQPDLVGLQEPVRFQIDDIRKAVPQYHEIGVARQDGKDTGEYSPILYRKNRFDVDESGTFWLSDTPETPGSRTWGNDIPRICTWAKLIDKSSGRAFYFYNTHFSHMSQPARERSAELITRHMRQQPHTVPIFMTGDLNADERNPVVQYLTGTIAHVPSYESQCIPPLPLVDTFRVLYPNAKEVGTFSCYDGRRIGAKIDYVLARPGVKVLETYICHDNKDGRYPSDHYPVFARVVLPQPAPTGAAGSKR